MNDFECPNCHGEEFWVNIPGPEMEEPRWFIRCASCENKYELIQNGTIQFIEAGHQETRHAE